MDITACTNRLNIIRNGNINCNSDKLGVSTISFTKELKDHQKSLLYSMNNLENNYCEDDHFKVYSTIGIISDCTGSGKSISMLAHICNTPVYAPTEKVIQQFGSFVYMKCKASDDFVRSNLIVVPHSCVTQWQQYIKEFTTLTFQTVAKRKEIDNFNIEHIKQIVLCTSSMYNAFLTAHRITWSRVIFDEADTINIPATYSPTANFVWFISSSLQNLLFPSGTYFEKCKLPNSNQTVVQRKYIDGIKRVGYIRETFRTLERYDADYVISKIVLKNSDDYVKSSFQLPEPKINIVKCHTPSYLKMLMGVVNNDIIQLLNAGNIDGAIDKIGCPIDSHENIIDSVTKHLNSKMNNAFRELEYLKSLEFTRQTDEDNNTKKIENLEKNIDTIKHKIECITERINSYKDDICNVCMDSHDNPTVVSCCQKVFCFQCITRCLNVKRECPQCRSQISTDSLIVIGEKKEKLAPEFPDKHEALSKILTNNPKGKYLIFSSHDQSFTYIEDALSSINQNFVRLMGSVHRVDSLLKRYKEGDLNVLMLNTSHYGTGLNLENTTDLIFYHKMSFDMEKQVIGRAQRVGRKIPLNIHYLYQENEITNV